MESHRNDPSRSGQLQPPITACRRLRGQVTRRHEAVCHRLQSHWGLHHAQLTKLEHPRASPLQRNAVLIRNHRKPGSQSGQAGDSVVRLPALSLCSKHFEMLLGDLVWRACEALEVITAALASLGAPPQQRQTRSTHRLLPCFGRRRWPCGRRQLRDEGELARR